MLAKAGLRIAACVFSIFTAISAEAQTAGLSAPPSLQLEFIEPTGTVDPTDSIDVWLRLTNTGTTAFSFDTALGAGNDPPFGLFGLTLPQTGIRLDVIPDNGELLTADFASFTQLRLLTSFACDDTFGICSESGLPYAFNWAAAPWSDRALDRLTTFSLEAGAQQDYLFGTFIPQDGGAPVGDYRLPFLGLNLSVNGLDAEGHRLTARVARLAQTCPILDCETPFTRTVATAVSPVPEPSTYALMLLGLGVVAVVRRQRGQNTHVGPG